MTISWVEPASGLLTTELELYEGSPVFSIDFVVTDDLLGDSVVATYVLRSGQIPEYYTLVNNGDNTATLQITPIVREMDQYVPEYEKPQDFTYDTDDTAGGNYATFGSALDRTRQFDFTIRASVESSNGEEFEDRDFSIIIENDYSSDRDSFVLDYFEGQTLKDDDGNDLAPEEYILYRKQQGYYI